ncbi:MAG: enoyl-CoA hydratase/isomerase family protein [Euryarchaeota archaeon]|nr:enoyl-CoA hydratase/isomerase family protein [Euryarchaeota archaeon]MDE1836821.1 enoyl-CoA hydratase/isomerase family protein [Euryarchaeota archaeon]MDE1881724.1 enoyl-CoA hydratase/isomerase family protein [Euryarchaeota archaeon]MDE2044805.1 enoyl-CoA hydratase/isomerase family protein [Thermoplasmata archaeon]
MQGHYISLRKEGKVGVIEINKPKANTYDHEMVLEFGRAIDEVRFDDSIKVAVTTSKVPKFFSAGADIEMLKGSEPDFKAMFCLNCQETLTKLESTPKVFIAALNGHTVGGGLEIALAHDLRFMIDDPKLQIGLPEVNLGVLPGTGGTQRLPRLINKSIALDMMITGRTLNPQEALHVGLVNYIYPADRFEPEWMAYAKRLAEGPARAVNLIKRSVQEGVEMTLTQGLALERELQNRLFVTKDAKEGLAAFIEKRKAVFAGA